MQLPSPSPNPNPQGHYPLGFTDPNSIPSGYPGQQPVSSEHPQSSNYPSATYGGGSQMPQSKDYPYVMQQQSSSPYPQPTPSNYPSSYLQSGPHGSGGNPTETYPYSSQSGYNPHGEAQSYVGVSPHIQGPPSSKGSKKKEDKGMGGVGNMSKLLLGTGMGAAGGLLVGNLAKKKFKKHHHHKGWKGKWKGWKGKGWKGKGWKGKGWKGWK